MGALILIMVAFVIYFLPAVVAMQRDHRQTTAIGALNLVAGWTFVGWVAALVWACATDTFREEELRRRR